MDSLTHIALGAIVGDAVAGKKLGKRAMVVGALAQSLPDIDFVQSFWLSPVDNLLAHRGFTHSILFALITSVLAGFACARWIPSKPMGWASWIGLFGLEMGIHLLIDSLNNYGIGWLEPFSHQRITFDVLFVADPFYSIWLGIGLLGLWIAKTGLPSRKYWGLASLIVSTGYVIYALYNKANVDADIRRALKSQGIAHGRLLTTPAPFNNWLWYFAAETDSGYQVGYRSVFDRSRRVDYSFFPRKEILLGQIKDKDAVGKLIRFSRGYFTVENRHDTLVFNDLRFGQVAGWSDPHAQFAFHYYLNFPDANLLVVQRGRFENWNRKTIAEFITRIEGR